MSSESEGESLNVTGQQKPRILIITDFYLPGYKSGGAVRTLVNTIERLGDEFEFAVITRNHDGWGDFTPYETVKTGEWQPVGGAQVFYFNGGMGLTRLKQLIFEAAPDAVFLVSFFSTLCVKALTLRRLKKTPNVAFVFAPQGELAPGALQIKSGKKKMFLRAAKNLGLYRGIVWRASAEEEKNDIRQIVGLSGEVYVVPDLSPRILLKDFDLRDKVKKRSGELRLIFLSRVNRKKNLSFALQAAQKLRGEIVFDVYGAHDDENYWCECRALIEQIPTNVRVRVHGSIDYRNVLETMSRYHFFVLPTLGENFGHVILEAMSAGCPVLLSDKTPWRGLRDKNVGWDLPLDDFEKWQNVLQRCADMPEDEYFRLAKAARAFALEWLAAPEVELANREIFRLAVSRQSQS